MTTSKQADKATTVDTPGGIRIHHREHVQHYADAALSLQSSLDSRRGVLLTSSFEYPGRLHALGHRFCRSAAGLHDPRAGVQLRRIESPRGAGTHSHRQSA